jgi:hypothetical protein
MVVASVLALMGLFNSLQSQWMQHRMILLGNPHGDYMISKIGKPPDQKKLSPDDYRLEEELYEKRAASLCAAMENAYVEGSLVVRVPFFGISFDVNDLGVLGGVAFLLILSCYQFFLSREIDNLLISFKAARGGGIYELATFYQLLAMRQVFTIPDSGFNKQSGFLRYLPKLITFIPVALLISIAVHDLNTEWIGIALAPLRFRLELSCQIICVLLSFVLAGSITTRLLRMDKIWNAVGSYISDTELKGSSPTEEEWAAVFRS